MDLVLAALGGSAWHVQRLIKNSGKTTDDLNASPTGAAGDAVPFESFLKQTKSKRGFLFHATIAFSVFVHAGALAWATVRSITEVEELPAPHMKLTFLRAPSLAPAAPKAAGPKDDGGPRKIAAPRRDVKPKPALIQPVLAPPVETQKPDPTPPAPVEEPVAAAPPTATPSTTETAGGGGTGTGVATGVPGGGSGVTGNGPPGGGLGAAKALPRKMLPEALGKLQRLSGAPPAFPPQLAKNGSLFVVMTKVCVSAEGSVDTVDVMKQADPLLDANVVNAVRGWRYKPLISGDTAVPFCTFVRFEFRSE